MNLGVSADVTPPISFHERHVSGLKTFFALRDLTFDFFALVKGLKSILLNGGIVDKYGIPIFPTDEPIALLLAEPFDPPSGHYNSPPSAKKSLVRE